jgi:hypothetical protein
MMGFEYKQLDQFHSMKQVIDFMEKRLQVLLESGIIEQYFNEPASW